MGRYKRAIFSRSAVVAALSTMLHVTMLRLSRHVRTAVHTGGIMVQKTEMEQGTGAVSFVLMVQSIPNRRNQPLLS